MISRSDLGLVAVLALASISFAQAGVKGSYPVYIDAQRRQAQAFVGAARNSENAFERVGCAVSAFDKSIGAANPFHASCTFVDAAGQTATCWTQDPQVALPLSGMNGDSRVYVWWNPAGMCTFIQVGNDSALEPKE